MDVGSKIKTARLAKGMTQEELGEILGVQKSAIAKYESGRVVNIKRNTLTKIADVLGIPPFELIFCDKDPKSEEAISDITTRMSTDDDFFTAVRLLYGLDSRKLSSLISLLAAFSATDD